jgi:DNA-binding transcriptional LysR family regulator
LDARDLHIAVTATTGALREGVTEYPLVQDPFMLVAPKGLLLKPEAEMDILQSLPFLRYDSSQLISQQIEAHLARQKLLFEERFEIGSHQALMALVARRIGWAITTPLGYMRAVRFHEDLEAFPLPFGAFSRRISLFSSSDWADRVPRDVAQTMRRLVQGHVIDPAVQQLPWLAGDLKVLED